MVHSKTPLLICLAFLILSVSSAVPVAAISINCTDFISTGKAWQWSPNTNYSAYNGFVVQSYLGAAYEDYVKINVSQIPANSTITSAYLKLYRTSVSRNATITFTVWNTSQAWNSSNVSWNTRPAGIVNTDNTTFVFTTTAADGFENIDVKNALQYAVNNGLPLSIKFNDSINDTNTTTFKEMFNGCSQTDDYFNAHLEVEIVTANGCNSTGKIIGSQCDGDTIITTRSWDCTNDSAYTCPEGTHCTQITPQADVYNLVHDFTDCSRCIYLYSNVPGQSRPILIWTNCRDPSMAICDTGYLNYCPSFIPGTVTCPSVYINNDNITSTPATVLKYTAGCINNVTRWINPVIDENGTVTDMNNLTAQVFGTNTTYVPINFTECYNTSTQCFATVNNVTCTLVACTPKTGADVGNADTSAAGGFASLFGTLFGITNSSVSLAVFSIFVSLIIGFILMYYTRSSQQGGNAFIFGTLAPLIMFAIMGWFPGWILIIMIVAAAFLVAKSLGLGGR